MAHSDALINLSDSESHTALHDAFKMEEHGRRERGKIKYAHSLLWWLSYYDKIKPDFATITIW